MSKKKKPRHDDNRRSGEHENKERSPGKKSRVPQRTSDDQAASTDAPGVAPETNAEVGPEDFEQHEPIRLTIIDMSARAGGTQIAVGRGTKHHVTMDDHASVTDRKGTRIGPAKIVSVGETTTFLMTPVSISDLEKAIVVIE